jgi:hypothetical protein
MRQAALVLALIMIAASVALAVQSRSGGLERVARSTSTDQLCSALRYAYRRQVAAVALVFAAGVIIQAVIPVY